MSEIATIQELFPEPVITWCCRIQDYTAELFKNELSVVSKAIDKRRFEFSCGRFCARKALHRMGQEPVPILHGKNGRPVWPKGFVGSISHSSCWAGAAVSRSEQIFTLGFDIETIDRIKAPILKRIVTTDERSRINKMTGHARQIYAALLFSAKEAFFKAFSSHYARPLRFKDISIIPKHNSAAFKIILNADLTVFLKDHPDPVCRYKLYEKDIFTAITYPAE